jgi:hypothetical protein
MNRTFRVIRSGFLLLSILIFLAIPIVGLSATVFSYTGTCSGAFSFDQPCAWWQYTAITMIYTAYFAVPALAVTLFIWLIMTVTQFFVMRRKK